MMNNTHLLKVANIIEDGRIAGPQKRIISVTKILEKKIKTTIVMPKINSQEFQKRCDELKLNYVKLPLTILNKELLNIILYAILFPYEILTLSRFLKKNNFDIVHVSGGSWQFKGILSAKLVNIKVIWHLNDTYTSLITRSIFKYASKFADAFIFASERTKKYYSKLVTKKISFLIQAPVDIDFFNPKIQLKSDKFIKKKKIKKKIVIGTIGNINPVKGHMTFLRAAEHILLQDVNVIFIIVGPKLKSQKKYFKNLSKFIRQNNIKNIHFIGSRKDVRPILKEIDIYICASFYESFPMSVWEAMAMKKAIITTDVGDVGKFVKNGINGYVVQAGDYKNLSKYAIKLIKSYKLRKKFGNISRKIAKENLNLKLCADKHFRAYHKLFYLN